MPGHVGKCCGIYDTTLIDDITNELQIIEKMGSVPGQFRGAKLVTVGGPYDQTYDQDPVGIIPGVKGVRYRLCQNPPLEGVSIDSTSVRIHVTSPDEITKTEKLFITSFLNREFRLPELTQHSKVSNFYTLRGFVMSPVGLLVTPSEYRILGPDVIRKLYGYDEKLILTLKDAIKNSNGGTIEVLLIKKQLELNQPILIEAGFKEDFSFVNPNTLNRVYHFVRSGS